MTVGEQADVRQRGHVSLYHRHLKRRARRLFRRWAKQYGEDAPTKYRFRGWES